MKLIPDDDYRDSDPKPDHDRALDGFHIGRLEAFIADREFDSTWRMLADKCCNYYDDDQSTPEKDDQARRDGLEPRNSNLIKPVINGVLGEEAKGRRDPVLEPDDDDVADVGDAMQKKLKEAQRETYADMAISNCYAGEVKAGVHWCEVSKNSDPLGYQYRVRDHHRNLIWWDMRCKSIDVGLYGRWLVRPEWRDLDEVIAHYPEHAEVLRNSADGWQTWMNGEMSDFGLNQAMELEGMFGSSRSTWLDGQRRRIQMFEVWYRMPAEVVTMKVRGRWVKWDENNPVHVEAAARGLVPLQKGVSDQVRMAMYAGPFRLTDVATTRRRFPYVPFFGFRTDKDNKPYGMVHSMLSPQDDFNERYMRLQWMLKAQQLMLDNDALDTRFNTVNDIRKRMMNPSMVAILRADRKNKDGMAFRNDLSLQREQFDMMNHAEVMIQKTAGRYAAQLGDAPTGVTSGKAINGLIEQGLVSMGELNDNYAFARRLVFEQLLDLIVEDHNERDMRVVLGTGQSKRVVVLNTMGPDPNAEPDPQTGQRPQIPINVVKDAPLTLGLAEVPTSAAYQQQQSQQLSDMIRALAGNPALNIILPAYVETTASFGPNRKQMADDIRRQSGLPTGQSRAEVNAFEAQQQQMQQQQQAMQERMAALELAHKEAEARNEAANAALAQAKVLLTQAQTLESLANAEKLATEPSEDEVISDVLMGAAGKGKQPEAAMH